MVSDPTREGNVLDIFLTNSLTLVESVNVTTGISDHDIVVADVKIRPNIQKLKPCTVHLCSKADWDSIKQEMQFFQSSVLDSCEGKNTETLWTELKANVDFLIDKYVPAKVLRGRKNLPWVTSEIKRMMNKRDRLYQVQKSGNEHDRALFKKAKYKGECKLKTAYNNYLMIVTLFLAQTQRNSSLIWKTVDKTLRALHHSVKMVNCKQTMSRKQTFWTKHFSLYLLQSHLWNSSSCVYRKYETFKTQVYTLLVIFHQILTAITTTCLISVFQWMAFRSYYRTWNQTKPPVQTVSSHSSSKS